MYSLEQIIAVTGDPDYMDALERMTFNALPAQTTDDYNARQYYQIANQVQVKRGVFNFTVPFSRGMNNVFGMRSGYTCCLANMHQGWPKFVQHLWYRTKNNGLAAFLYGPSEITTKVGRTSTGIMIKEVTNYPFSNQITLNFYMEEDVNFDLHFRIPGWCSKASVKINGEDLSINTGERIVTITRNWKNGDQLTLDFPMDLKISSWGNNTRTVERGPLVYALKLSEIWKKESEPSEGEYSCVFPGEAWNYGILQDAVKDPSKNITVRVSEIDFSKFIWNLNNSPVELRLPAKKIPDWNICGDIAPVPITGRHGVYMGGTSDKTEIISLVPYGCTKVRVVAFPVVK
jgi:hypothetical protein